MGFIRHKHFIFTSHHQLPNRTDSIKFVSLGIINCFQYLKIQKVLTERKWFNSKSKDTVMHTRLHALKCLVCCRLKWTNCNTELDKSF